MVLSYFPPLYEDELLYSWFARYHVRSCNISPQATMKDLFDSPKALAVPDLPTHLGMLYERLNHFDGPELIDWVSRHTFYRYYTIFAKQEIQQLVYEAIITGIRPGALHMMTGVMASSISEPTYFRFCPHCMEEDYDRYGETYWRLCHQLPSVYVCILHETLLQNSNVHFRSQQKHVFTAATKQFSISDSSPLIFSEKTMHFLQIFAEESSNIIQKSYAFTWDGLQQAYKYLLQKQGFASIKGIIDQQALAEQFLRFYGTELLSIMQSTIQPDKDTCWLKSITRKHRKAFHPIRHLLLIHFLGETLETIYKYASKTYQPFGKGPYLCLNAAANHYLKPIIPIVKVTICTDTRRPVGTFTCTCGFSYSRRGPDTSPEDRYKIGRIKQFGSIWHEKLHELIHVENLSFYAAARCLNADAVTIKKYADGGKNSRDSKPINDDQTECLEKQKQWLDLQQQHPNTSKTDLRKHAPSLYIWLYRHNKVWLDEHSPKKKNTVSYHQRVDWIKRDQQLLEATKKAVEDLLLSPKPIQINTSRIGNEIGKLALLERHLDKLPKTKRYLTNVVETIEQFQVRRVQWAALELFNNHNEVTEWRMKQLAGLKKEIPITVQHEIQRQIELFRIKGMEG